MEQQTLRDMYRDLMRMNRQSFEGGKFDIAYHTLTSALHCAQELQDTRSLREIERTANEQLAYIDAHHPEYEHSSPAAATRRHASIFQTLAHQANARILIIEKSPGQRAIVYPPR